MVILEKWASEDDVGPFETRKFGGDCRSSLQ